MLYRLYAFSVLFLMFSHANTQSVLHLQHHGTEAHTLAFLLRCSCLRFELSASAAEVHRTVSTVSTVGCHRTIDFH